MHLNPQQAVAVMYQIERTNIWRPLDHLWIWGIIVADGRLVMSALCTGCSPIVCGEGETKRTT
jgi:hypothetical protein